MTVIVRTRIVKQKQRLEDVLVRTVGRYLADRGFEVWLHVYLQKLEIDIVARKRKRGRDIILIVECKLKPKIKLVQQVQARAPLANYVYACVPAQYRDIMLRRLPDWCGLMIVKNCTSKHMVEIVRPAQYLNNDEAVYHFSKLLDIAGDKIAFRYYAPRRIIHIPPTLLTQEESSPSTGSPQVSLPVSPEHSCRGCWSSSLLETEAQNWEVSIIQVVASLDVALFENIEDVGNVLKNITELALANAGERLIDEESVPVTNVDKFLN